jgi:hypothetical protein
MNLMTRHQPQPRRISPFDEKIPEKGQTSSSNSLQTDLKQPSVTVAVPLLQQDDRGAPRVVGPTTKPAAFMVCSSTSEAFMIVHSPPPDLR